MRTKARLRDGQWPDSPAPAHYTAELTVAARRLAMSALDELSRLGVVATLDKEGSSALADIQFSTGKRPFSTLRSRSVPPRERFLTLIPLSHSESPDETKISIAL